VLALLVCGGAATAGVLMVTNRDDDPVVTQPTSPPEPSSAPDGDENQPDGQDDVPTSAPTGVPGLPGIAGKTVVYEVTGSGRADITYVDDVSGETKELRRQKLPWRLEFTSSPSSILLTVTATASDGDNEDVGCRITVDGRESAADKGSIIGAFCIGTVFQ